MSFISLKDRLRIPTFDNVNHAKTGKVKVDHMKCNGCKQCVEICPANAIVVRGEGKKKKAYMVEEEITPCVSCNCCAAICSQNAVTAIHGYDFAFFYKQIDRGEFTLPRKFI